MRKIIQEFLAISLIFVEFSSPAIAFSIILEAREYFQDYPEFQENDPDPSFDEDETENQLVFDVSLVLK